MYLRKRSKNVKEAIAGASDILAESVADEADYRIRIRKLTVKSGSVVSSAKKENEKSVYEMYYDLRSRFPNWQDTVYWH